MSIESSSAPKGAKALASADSHGKKAGKPADASGGGFSALMNLLTATEDAAASLVADASSASASQAEKDDPSEDVAGATGAAELLLPPFTVSLPAPVHESAPALASTSVSASESASAQIFALFGGIAPLVSSAIPQELAADLPEAALVPAPVTGATADAGAGAPQLVVGALPQPTAEVVGLPDKAGSPTTTTIAAADTGALQKSALASLASDALNVPADAGQAPADLAQTSPVSALLAHKSAFQAHIASAAQQDLKELRASAVSQTAVPTADMAMTLLAGGSDFAQPQGRFGARPGSGQSGTGFEGTFGQAMSAASRADAVFEVAPASAVVADTAVAETVSYWAGQGVQTAELTLEGFGDEPVQVSILLNGDQAQIDFRTDQAAVRQVLEAAAAELKDLLSSQGLQLAGVSVGTSGKGSENGSERRSRPSAQQVTMVKTEPVGAAPARSANPAVGRSLDLFV